MRAIRDIVAECMRRERLGLLRPLWADWATFADDECEHVRKRADHLIALLGEHGVRLVGDGETGTEPRPAEIWRYGVVGKKAERIVRRVVRQAHHEGGDLWQIVLAEDGKETVEQEFTAAEAAVNGGLVLTDDPAAKAIPGLGRQLAALAEIFRICAGSSGSGP